MFKIVWECFVYFFLLQETTSPERKSWRRTPSGPAPGSGSCDATRRHAAARSRASSAGRTRRSRGWPSGRRRRGRTGACCRLATCAGRRLPSKTRSRSTTCKSAQNNYFFIFFAVQKINFFVQSYQSVKRRSIIIVGCLFKINFFPLFSGALTRWTGQAFRRMSGLPKRLRGRESSAQAAVTFRPTCHATLRAARPTRLALIFGFWCVGMTCFEVGGLMLALSHRWIT